MVLRNSSPNRLRQQENCLIQIEFLNSHTSSSLKSGYVIEIHISTTVECHQGNSSSLCSFRPEDYDQQLSNRGEDRTSPRTALVWLIMSSKNAYIVVPCILPIPFSLGYIYPYSEKFPILVLFSGSVFR